MRGPAAHAVRLWQTLHVLLSSTASGTWALGVPGPASVAPLIAPRLSAKPSLAVPGIDGIVPCTGSPSRFGLFDAA